MLLKCVQRNRDITLEGLNHSLRRDLRRPLRAWEGHKVEVSKKTEQMQIIWEVLCCNKSYSQNLWLNTL